MGGRASRIVLEQIKAPLIYSTVLGFVTDGEGSRSRSLSRNSALASPKTNLPGETKSLWRGRNGQQQAKVGRRAGVGQRDFHELAAGLRFIAGFYEG